jgi:hypothetical protein
MTIRTALGRKFRLAHWMVAFGFVAFITSFILGGIFESEIWNVLGCLSVASFFSGMFYQFLGIRCPQCHNRVGSNLEGLTSWFKSQRVIKYCPFCATDLDSDMAK